MIHLNKNRTDFELPVVVDSHFPISTSVVVILSTVAAVTVSWVVILVLGRQHCFACSSAAAADDGLIVMFGSWIGVSYGALVSWIGASVVFSVGWFSSVLVCCRYDEIRFLVCRQEQQQFRSGSKLDLEQQEERKLAQRKRTWPMCLGAVCLLLLLLLVVCCITLGRTYL